MAMQIQQPTPSGSRYRKNLVLIILSFVGGVIITTILVTAYFGLQQQEVETEPYVYTNEQKILPEQVSHADYDGYDFNPEQAAIGEPARQAMDGAPAATVQESTAAVVADEPKPAPQKPSELEKRLEQRKLELLDEAFKAQASGGIVQSIADKAPDLTPQAIAINGNDANYLSYRVHKPISPYIIHEGTMLPGKIINALNSDLPGQISGIITTNVYDTITGEYLLIPSGTKVVGFYNSNLKYGQSRLQIAWTRMLFPDGSSLKLGEFSGMDARGFSGVTGEVNNHWGKLWAGVIMGTMLQTGVNLSRSDNQTVVSDSQRAFAGSTSAALDGIVNRSIDVQPTIQVKEGERINIYVAKDMILREWN